MLGRFEQALYEVDQYSGRFSYGHAAFMQSRVGRYLEAQDRRTEGRRLAESSQNAFADFSLQTSGAIVALERGDHDRARDLAQRALEKVRALRQQELRESSAQVGHTLLGIAHARSGNLEAARQNLESLRTLLEEPHWRPMDWFLGSLEGEGALAAGDLDTAAASFRAVEPEPKMLFHRWALPGLMKLHNGPSRDGLARVAMARGDLDGAIEIYRRLNTPGLENPWTSVLEPRYVLEVARLLDEKGDHVAAREEYARFLELWKNADPDLPELAEARTRLAQLEVESP
jgi:tetratricopeptide (TPR) repeat protein